MVKGGKGKGKKKKGGSKKGGFKKGGSHKVRKQALGVTVGGGVTAYKVLTYPSNWYGGPNLGVAVVKAALDMNMDNFVAIGKQMIGVAKANAGPALIGAAVSFGEDVPLVGPLYKDVVKKPADRLLGKIQKKLLRTKKAKWRF